MLSSPSPSSSHHQTSPAAELRRDLYAPRSIDDPHYDGGTPPLVISVLASLLHRTISRNITTDDSHFVVTRANSSPFHSQFALDLSIHSFLHRIHRHARPSPSIFVAAYIYLDRLHRSLPLLPSNSQRLLLTTIMVASKFLQDVNYKNSYYARIGGVTTAEMNAMEMELLSLMGFRLHVNVRIFESYCRHLEREVSAGGGYQIERALCRCMWSLEDHISSGDHVGEKRLEHHRLARLIL